MKICRVIFSANEPNAKEVLWLKPVTGGFALYFLTGGKWVPLKLVDDNGTSKVTDDTAVDAATLIGSVQDDADANTINGAKAYADNAVDGIKGSADDTAEDLTLYGLKKAIEALS